MSNLPPLIWTEIGRKPGKYALNAISINRELFPDLERILIVNSKYRNEIPKKLCTVVTEEDLYVGPNYRRFNEISKSWSHSHESYWQNTTKRFFVIENYMIQHNIPKSIHLESDCVLLSTEYLTSVFQDPNWGLRYTKQADLSGCASIMLVNKIEAIERFNQYVLENWQKPDVTDMDLLGNYVNRDIDSDYLPSGDVVNSDIVFDAGAIGQYFLGGEARNNRFPFSDRGRISTNKGSFDPVNYRIEHKKKHIYLVDIYNPAKNIQLGCLHVHSKRIPKTYSQLIRRLIRESNSNRGRLWKLGRLDVGVVCERVLSKIARLNPKRVNSDVRLR